MKYMRENQESPQADTLLQGLTQEEVSVVLDLISLLKREKMEGKSARRRERLAAFRSESLK